MKNLDKFLEIAIRQHSDVFFVLYAKNNQFAFINEAVEKLLGWKPEEICASGFCFENLMMRPKTWKLISKDVNLHSEKGDFFSFPIELKSAKADALPCIGNMKKMVFENEEYLFGEIFLPNAQIDQGLQERPNPLASKNASLMRSLSFNKYVYDLICSIQKLENIKDIIETVCNRLIARDNNEFSVELVQLMVRKSDRLNVEFSASHDESIAMEFTLLSRAELFLKSSIAGSELRDGRGGIAVAINLFDVDQLDAVVAIKTHSEEQLTKELSELLVIINSMARQINTVYLTERLRKESIEDPLTGAFNRRFFDKNIRDEVNRAGRHKRDLSLIYLDIDFFKKINDLYGHAQGDLVLKETVRHCNTTGRASDQVYRYGGEEFVLLLPETNFQQAMIRAEKIREIIQQTAFTNIAEPTKPLKITVSLGVSEYKGNQSIESFVNNADNALYQAKSSGRNRVVGSNS